MAPGLTDRILVWSLSDTVAYTLESCDWYSADSFWDLYFSVAQFIQNQLDEFYAEFSEQFNLAEFPDVGNQLQPSEGAVYLKAAGPQMMQVSVRSRTTTIFLGSAGSFATA